MTSALWPYNDKAIIKVYWKININLHFPVFVFCFVQFMNILFTLHLISGLIQCIKSGSGKRESQLGDGRGRRKTVSSLGRFSLNIVFSCANPHPSSVLHTHKKIFLNSNKESLLLRLTLKVFFLPLSSEICKVFV